MSITIGSWGIPALVTLVAFGWILVAGIRTTPASGYGSIADGLFGMILLAVATIVSLLAWLVWALLT